MAQVSKACILKESRSTTDMNTNINTLAYFFNQEGITCTEYSYLDYQAQNAVRNLVQKDEYWEDWEYEGVFEFNYKGKTFQVIKSMHTSHY